MKGTIFALLINQYLRTNGLEGWVSLYSLTEFLVIDFHPDRGSFCQSSSSSIALLQRSSSRAAPNAHPRVTIYTATCQRVILKFRRYFRIAKMLMDEP
jgi:hypothetical protein